MCDPPFTADSNVNFWSSVLPSATYSLIGSSRLRKRVHNGPSLNLGVSDPSLLGPTPSSIIPKMSCTCSECITIVVVPAAVASSAAINFVDIPPVPSDVPNVEVDTESSPSSQPSRYRDPLAGLTLLSDFLYISNHSNRFGIWIVPRIVGISMKRELPGPIRLMIL